jgi:hypothetical protein
MNTKTLAVSAVVVALCAAMPPVPPLAYAREGGSPMNGRYLVTSNGGMAKTNDVFHDEQTIRQVWTVTSSCVDSTACTGRAISSQGWSADLKYDGAWWVVSHVVPDWQPCPDGTAAAGHQIFRFWGVDPAGQTDDSNTTFLAGSDTTSGRSGDCGINKVLSIVMPIRVQQIPEEGQ